MTNSTNSTNLIVKISLLTAIAVLLMYLEFPILSAFPWLKLDLGDVPALVGAFAFGPLAGVIIEALKNILIILIKGTSSAGVGELANFIIGVSFILPASIIYKRKQTIINVSIGLVISILVMGFVGVLANKYVLIPLYGYDKAGVAWINNYLIYGVFPFNLIKGAIVSIVTLVIYNRISKVVIREYFLNKK